MFRSGARQKSWIDRLRVEVQRDPKKAIILSVLVVLLVGLVLRDVLRRSGPASVSAAVAVDGNRPQPSASAAMASKTPAPVAAQDANEIAGSSPHPVGLSRATIDRDLFTAEVTYFPPKERPKSASVVRRVDDGVVRQEAQERAIRAQAKALSLQSTVSGDVPTAMINGEVLCAGEEIAGFRVVKITTRSCEVQKGNLLILLEMAKN